MRKFSPILACLSAVIMAGAAARCARPIPNPSGDSLAAQAMAATDSAVVYTRAIDFVTKELSALRSDAPGRYRAGIVLSPTLVDSQWNVAGSLPPRLISELKRNGTIAGTCPVLPSAAQCTDLMDVGFHVTLGLLRQVALDTTTVVVEYAEALKSAPSSDPGDVKAAAWTLSVCRSARRWHVCRAKPFLLGM